MHSFNGIITLSNWKLKIKIRKIENSKNSHFFMSVASLYTPCFVMFCVFLYGTFCHGAHKLDLSTLFTTFFLWTSLPFILLICVCFNVQRVCLCTGHFVIVPLNLTCPHCLQHFVLNISCILHNMTRV